MPRSYVSCAIVHFADNMRKHPASRAAAVGVLEEGIAADGVEETVDLALRVMKTAGAGPSVGAAENRIVAELLLYARTVRRRRYRWPHPRIFQQTAPCRDAPATRRVALRNPSRTAGRRTRFGATTPSTIDCPIGEGFRSHETGSSPTSLSPSRARDKFPNVSMSARWLPVSRQLSDCRGLGLPTLRFILRNTHFCYKIRYGLAARAVKSCRRRRESPTLPGRKHPSIGH